jgi:hypothetical protein
MAETPEIDTDKLRETIEEELDREGQGFDVGNGSMRAFFFISVPLSGQFPLGKRARR